MSVRNGRWTEMAPLQPDYPALGLFGRAFLMGIGQWLVVPSPWTGTIWYRFLAERVALPNGRPLLFTGQAGDIWPVFVGAGLVGWLQQAPGFFHLHWAYGLSGLLLTWALSFLMCRWFTEHVTTDDGRVQLSFEGGMLAFIGWQALVLVSVITIIGWAWVGKFMMRWMCRSVQGSLSFEFTGGGWGILWRSVAFVLVSMLIIPIPWAFSWLMNWFVSQISVAPAAR